MSKAIIEWSDQASEQFQELPPHLQQNAITLASQLQDNPTIGKRYNAHTLKSGKVVQVFALYGLQLALSYTFEGWFRKRISIVIEEIRRSDLPSLDEYEERRRR